MIAIKIRFGVSLQHPFINWKEIIKITTQFLKRTWLSWIFLGTIIFLFIVPLVINFKYADLNKVTDHPYYDKAMSNTLEFTGWAVLIMTCLMCVTIPALFFAPKSVTKTLGKISIGKSMVLSMGIQIAFSTMFYSETSDTQSWLTDLFGVGNFRGEDRSYIPLFFFITWTTIPSVFIVIGSNVSQYINAHLSIRPKNTKNLSLYMLNYVLENKKVILMVLFLGMMSQLHFSPVLLFGDEDAAINYGKQTLGLLSFTNLQTGRNELSASFSVYLLLLSLAPAMLVLCLNIRIMHDKIKLPVIKRVSGNERSPHSRWAQTLSSIWLISAVVFVLLPILLSLATSFSDIDYNDYYGGQSGWTSGNYNKVLGDSSFQSSLWESMGISLLAAVMAFAFVTSFLVFIANRKNKFNQLVLWLFIFLSSFSSSVYLFGLFKMLSDLSFADNWFLYFVIPRINYVARMVVLLSIFRNKNINAASIYDASGISLWRRHMNVLKGEWTILIGVVLLSSIRFTDSYLYNSLGSTTTGHEQVIVYIRNSFMDLNGEIDSRQQAAAIVFIFALNLTLWWSVTQLLPSSINTYHRYRKWKDNNEIKI